MQFYHQYLQKHLPLLVIALVILAFLMLLPFVYVHYSMGASYKGIERSFADDDLFYFARIRDVVDGHPFISNAYLAEHKDGVPQQLFLGEYLLAQPLRWFGIAVIRGQLFYAVILPSIIFILTYIIFYLITQRRFWSLGGSSLLIFGIFLFKLVRPISPQFNFIFWLTQFILLWLLVARHRTSRLFVALNGLNFGFLFYIYPYYWTFYAILMGILIMVYFFQNRYLAYRIAWILVIGPLVASYYFYLLHLSTRLPEYQETLARLGMIITRMPSGFSIVILSGIIIGVYILACWRYRLVTDERFTFFVAGLSATIIAVNQHIITGRNFEFSSHYSMLAIFWSIFALAFLIVQLGKSGKYHINSYRVKLFAVVITVAAILHGTYSYVQRAVAFDVTNYEIQHYAPIFDWLNQHSPLDSVVYADNVLSGYIPVYTHDNVFYNRNADAFFISNYEALDRFILNNLGDNFDRDMVIERQRSIYGVHYVDEYGHTQQSNKLRKFFGMQTLPEIRLPEQAIQRVIDRARVLKSGNIREEFNKYRLDYIVWPKSQLLPSYLLKLPVNKVFENVDTIILEMIP